MTSPSVLITGATEGIGRAIAFTLGRAGYRVGLCARTPAKVQEVLAALRAEGITAAGAPADVGDDGSVRTMVAEIVGQLGPVDTLVNNAGVGILKPFAELSLADWDQTMATNLRSLFLVTREVLPGMRARGRGTIVNIASLAGKNAVVGGTAYAASKHAVLGFSKSLMLEVRKEGVRVVAICPGSVETGFGQGRTVPKISKTGVLLPEDVAEVVLDTLRLPERALMSEIDLRPANPA
jgi:3-oxoacyl-[acyl-carrier protein] reductase